MSMRIFVNGAVLLATAVLTSCGSGSQHTTSNAAKDGSTQGENRSSKHLREQTARKTQPMSGAVVAVDPGHNGGNSNHATFINHLVDIGTKKKACDTTGTETASGYTEAEYNWDVALKIAKDLRELGAKVVLTRNSNKGVGPCINRRAEIGNRSHADLAISIHADGGPVSGRGFHVIMPAAVKGLTVDIAQRSRALGLNVRKAYANGTGVPFATYLGDGHGYTVRDDLGGLNLSDVPKIFIETGNMSNPGDAQLLESPKFRERAANAITSGIYAYWVASRRK